MTTSTANSSLSRRPRSTNWRNSDEGEVEKRQGHGPVSSPSANSRKCCSGDPDDIFGTHRLCASASSNWPRPASIAQQTHERTGQRCCIPRDRAADSSSGSTLRAPCRSRIDLEPSRHVRPVGRYRVPMDIEGSMLTLHVVIRPPAGRTTSSRDPAPDHLLVEAIPCRSPLAAQFLLSSVLLGG